MALIPKRISDIIRADCITLKGGRNSLKAPAILFLLFFALAALCFSPIMGIYLPIFSSCFLVPMIFQNEMKYHSEKYFFLVPVSRRNIVNARFIFVLGIFLAISAASYLLMHLSAKMKLYYSLIDPEADLIAIMVRNISVSETGFINFVFFLSFFLGVSISSGQLKKYFRNSDSFNASLVFGTVTKSQKKELFYVLLLLCIPAVWILILQGVIPAVSVLMVTVQMFVMLMQAADGALLGAVFVTMGIFTAVYNYISAVVEFEEKDI